MHDPKTYTEGSVQRHIVVVQSGPYVMPAEVNSFYQWKQSQAKRSGIAILVVAAIALVCNIVWLAIPGNRFVESYRASYIGIWGAFFFTIPGIVILLAGIRPTKCRLAWALIMTLLGFVAAIAMLTIAGIQLAIDTTTTRDPTYEMTYRTCMAFGAIFVFLSAAALVLFLKISILSCRGLCCSTTNPGLVIATPHQASNHYLIQPNSGQLVADPYSYGSTLPHGDAPPPYQEEAANAFPIYPPPSYSAVVEQQQFQPK